MTPSISWTKRGIGRISWCYQENRKLSSLSFPRPSSLCSLFFPSFLLFFFFTLLSPSLLFIPIRSCLFFRISLACFLGCARVGELKLFTTRVEEEQAVEEKMGRRVIPRGRYSGNKWGRGVEKERSKGCFERGKKAEDVATQIPR